MSSVTFRRRLLPTIQVTVMAWFGFVLTGLGAITWNITYQDVVNGTGVGFDDAMFGTDRQGVVSAVLDYVDATLNETGAAEITIKNSETDGSGFLASAGPFVYTGPNGFSSGFMHRHITTGVDPSPTNPADANATFDFGYNWNAGLGAPAGSEFDLFTVALHELSHALGFLSLVGSSGTSQISGGDPGVFSNYDSYLERGDGTALFGAGGDFLGVPGDLTSDDVFFNGPNAVAANGGFRVPVYSPSMFASGSSIAHITPSDAVMQYSIAPGVQRRNYSAAEIGIFQDVGYANALLVPIPEASSVFMAALSLLALRQLRRRSAAA